MRYRTLGKTGVQVSEIGYGAWGIGNVNWTGAKDDESLRALHRAIDLGMNYIDTALAYGDGHSERLVGQIVKERKEKINIATKVPPMNKQWPASAVSKAEETFPAHHIVSSTEQSLRNLGVDAIDVQQFHVWSDEWVNQGDWMEAIFKLKQEGKIKHFGVSINDHEPENVLRLLETGLVDAIQLIYNIFDQTPEEKLLAACQKHNVGTVIRVALDEGGLTGKVTPDSVFDDSDFRSHYFRGNRKRDVYERVTAIAADLEVPLEKMAEIALRFVLSHPAVSTVIPGMRSVRNVEINCGLSDGTGLTASQLIKLKAHSWFRNFYQGD